jgi:KDO2-lipid IV(A) lauroyltransferase
MKSIQYYVLSLLIRFGLFMSTVLPERTVTVFCTSIARLCFPFFPRYRKRISDNLRIAFGPSLERKQLHIIRKTVASNIGLNLAEVVCSATDKKKHILDRVTLHGAENLDSALAGGKGIIAFSAHMGNFMLLGAKMLEQGYPFTVLVKESKHQTVAYALRRLQQKQGGRYIYIKPWRPALLQLLGCLKRNEIVCLIADENKRRSGITVDFLGHPAPTAIGPAVLTLRTGAPLLPVFILRDGDSRQNIYIEPHLELNLKGNSNENIRTITAAYTKVIEHYVRRYPEQWFWINNRWKKEKPKRA